jgi:hypothetical protein
MSLPIRDRLGPAGRYVAMFLAGMLVTAVIALAVVMVWRTTSPAAQSPAQTSVAPPPSSSPPSPSIDPNAGDYEHDHDTVEDERPQWEPAVLGFAKNFTTTNGRDAAKWRERLTPYVAPAVRDQLAEVDPEKVTEGRYRSYELLETGNYQIAAKITYREGWALVLYVTSDGHDWRVTAYDKWEQLQAGQLHASQTAPRCITAERSRSRAE